MNVVGPFPPKRKRLYTMKPLVLKPALIFLLFIAGQAQAATLYFSGTAFNQMGVFAGQGSLVYGYISFPDAMLNNGGFAFAGWTNHFSINGANANAPFGFKLTNGSETHSWTSTHAADGAFNEIQVTDNTSRDAWSFDSSAGAPQTTTAVSMDWMDTSSKTFVAPGSKNLTGTEINPLFMNFGAINSQNNVMWVRNNSTAVLGSLSFQIDNLSAVPSVPIPAAAWLFGSALLALGIIKRRKA